MQGGDHISRSFIFSMILLLLMDTSGCLKRMTVPPISPEISKGSWDAIYVKFKSGGKGRTLMKSPRLDGAFLIGKIDGRETKSPLADIDSVKLVKVHKKEQLLFGPFC